MRDYEVLTGDCESADYLRDECEPTCKHRLAFAHYVDLGCSIVLIPAKLQNYQPGILIKIR